MGSYEGFISTPSTFYKGNDASYTNNTGGATAIENYGMSVSFSEVSSTNIKRYYMRVNYRNQYLYGVYAGRFNNSVNLTDYRYIKAYLRDEVLSNDGVMILGISQSPSATSYSAQASLSSSGTAILDITNLTGNYFVYFKVSGTNASVRLGDYTDLAGISSVILSNT